MVVLQVMHWHFILCVNVHVHIAAGGGGGRLMDGKGAGGET